MEWRTSRRKFNFNFNFNFSLQAVCGTSIPRTIHTSFNSSMHHAPHSECTSTVACVINCVTLSLLELRSRFLGEALLGISVKPTGCMILHSSSAVQWEKDRRRRFLETTPASLEQYTPQTALHPPRVITGDLNMIK